MKPMRSLATRMVVVGNNNVKRVGGCNTINVSRNHCCCQYYSYSYWCCALTITAITVVVTVVVVTFITLGDNASNYPMIKQQDTWRGIVSPKYMTTTVRNRTFSSQTTPSKATVGGNMASSSASESHNDSSRVGSTGSGRNYKSRFTNSSIATSNSSTSSSKNDNSHNNKKKFFPSVDAFTMPERRTVHRVLAYGDSLTAGTSGHQLFPYSVYLEHALQQQQQQLLQQQQSDAGSGSDISSNNNSNVVVVRHRGIPGMKAQEMVQQMDDERRGLRNVIQSIVNPSLSIVIILAGTNDLGYELLYSNNDVNVAAQKIVQNLLTLHDVCYENDVPFTIAIGIPSSGYQHRNANARTLASLINTQLQQQATKVITSTNTIDNVLDESTTTNIERPKRSMIYMDFPFDYVEKGENWNDDTLHFSELGYQLLGTSLVTIVQQLLLDINTYEQN
jgi:lysophospholipase L1-like esterase